MPSMTTYSFGDVVLVAFPFTNLLTTKKRPAVVISHVSYQQSRSDVILMAITSQIRPVSTVGEFVLRDCRGAGLAKPSSVKPVIATMEQARILRHLGKFSLADESALRKLLTEILR